MPFIAIVLVLAAHLPIQKPSTPEVPVSSCTVETPASEGSDSFVSAGNDVDHEWEVTLTKAGPVVTRHIRSIDWTRLPSFLASDPSQQESFIGRVTAIPVSDGYLIGTDNGEWGGSAWWSDRRGKRHYDLFDANVLGFVRIGHDFVVVTGLSHLTLLTF